MPDPPNKTAALEWECQSITQWLLDEGRFSADLNELVSRLGDQMLAAGAPLWRLRLSMRTLHPLITAVTSIWERDGGAPQQIESTHGLEGRSGYIGSPLEVMERTRQIFRKKLGATLSERDHRVLHELKARGGTDYLGIPIRFTGDEYGILVFTTDAADGFSERDVERFVEVASLLAPIAEVFRTQRVSLAIAEAYLGPRAGQRVLDGRITRGDIETIDAAILLSDIRDWTGINNRLPAETALALANRYFEIIADAVEPLGGEILQFLGDGVLAIFPTDDRSNDVFVCERALAAATRALQAAHDSDPPLDLSFGIGMHFGEVLYGNIGSASRIDFTVLGRAVNTAARIEGLCSRLERPILFSQDFADRLRDAAILVAEEALKGQDFESAVFASPDEPGTVPVSTGRPAAR